MVVQATGFYDVRRGVVPLKTLNAHLTVAWFQVASYVYAIAKKENVAAWV